MAAYASNPVGVDFRRQSLAGFTGSVDFSRQQLGAPALAGIFARLRAFVSSAICRGGAVLRPLRATGRSPLPVGNGEGMDAATESASVGRHLCTLKCALPVSAPLRICVFSMHTGTSALRPWCRCINAVDIPDGITGYRKNRITAAVLALRLAGLLSLAVAFLGGGRTGEASTQSTLLPTRCLYSFSIRRFGGR